ncbi:hypothetical protein EJ04DRAFT_555841 [Polyplosphaeria fusca]|uniref:Homeobox domain-containing protein n=1 Tax=Polyplosphaeria fusca TaxID=682080 RepID=A0A9P4UX14_9PLEO|nr:hypothetical protein EJ04DRAFT_555841 [Polyplosphaeria fusca]
MTARDVTIEQHDLYTLFPSTASYFPADEDEFSSVSNHWGNWSHPTNDVLFPNSTQTPAVGLPDGVRWDATPDPSQNSVACIPESFTPGSVANNSGSLDKDNAPKPTGLIPELTAQPESLHSVSTGPNEPQRTRRRQPRISSSAKKILERFFTDSPYPLAREIEGLTVSTGLEFKKIRNWFNNTRARRVSPCQDSNGNRAVGDVHQETKQEQDGEVRNPNSHRVSSSYELHELTKENEQLCRNTRDHEENFPTYSSRDHTGSCGTPISCRSLEELSKETQGSQKPPLEAWVSSPLQSEPVAIAAIRAASMSTSDAGTSSDHYLDSPSFQLQSRAPSVISSFASSASSITSQSTNLSTPSRYSRTSIGASRIRRRGRKRMHATFELNPTSRNRKQILNKGGSHFCTFCYKRLRGYYEWTKAIVKVTGMGTVHKSQWKTELSSGKINSSSIYTYATLRLENTRSP